MEAASGSPSFTPKTDHNLSLVEYELVPVRGLRLCILGVIVQYSG